ncbi:MAG: arylsulfatase [Alphaproteobacteria bacterium]|nr:arylsulfatase [Alphaproteobacteria bacterium]
MRRHLALILIGLALAVPAGARGADAPPAEKPRPNIVLMLIDDAALMDLGAFGGEARTPHIDALAQSGAMAVNYHTSPLCSPSRAMLLTGVDNHKTGVATIEEVLPRELAGKPGYSLRLEPGVVTVASRLKAAGYRTSMVGKWHLGHGEGDLPNAHGFDRSLALDASGADNWEQKPYMPYYHDAPWFEDGKPVQLPETFYSSELIIDRAIRYIDEARGTDAPFLSYVAFQAVHIPVQAPRTFSDHYKGQFDSGWDAMRTARWQRAKALGLIPVDAPLAPMPAGSRRWESLSVGEQRMAARSMEVYAGMIEAMDHHIGRLVEHLKKTGEFDNTIFVLTSDNGPEPSDPVHAPGMNLWMMLHGYEWTLETMGEKGSLGYVGREWAAALASPGKLFKFYTTQGGLRVPFVISGPGVAPGSRVTGLTFVTDVTPTLLDMAGVAVEPKPGEIAMTGRSLAAHLSGMSGHPRGETDWVGTEVAGNAALYRGRYKLSRNAPPLSDGAWQVHDLVTDPGETHNLAESAPALLASLLEDYAAYEKRMGVLPLPPGYDVQQQIVANSLRKQFAAYWWVLALLVGCVAGASYLVIGRLRRGRAA